MSTEQGSEIKDNSRERPLSQICVGNSDNSSRKKAREICAQEHASTNVFQGRENAEKNGAETDEKKKQSRWTTDHVHDMKQGRDISLKEKGVCERDVCDEKGQHTLVTEQESHTRTRKSASIVFLSEEKSDFSTERKDKDFSLESRSQVNGECGGRDARGCPNLVSRRKEDTPETKRENSGKEKEKIVEKEVSLEKFMSLSKEEKKNFLFRDNRETKSLAAEINNNTVLLSENKRKTPPPPPKRNLSEMRREESKEFCSILYPDIVAYTKKELMKKQCDSQDIMSIKEFRLDPTHTKCKCGGGEVVWRVERKEEVRNSSDFSIMHPLNTILHSIPEGEEEEDRRVKTNLVLVTQGEGGREAGVMGGGTNNRKVTRFSSL